MLCGQPVFQILKSRKLQYKSNQPQNILIELTELVWSGVAPSLYCLAILEVKLSIIGTMESRDYDLTDISLILRSYDFHSCIWTTKVCKSSSFCYALGIV